jgi:hypothetical protein
MHLSKKSLIMPTSNLFLKQHDDIFFRCCKTYDSLQMFVAWVGDPANNIPFSYLEQLDSINVTLGFAFYQSHPDGIERLMKMDKNIRIMHEKPLFHPKVYIFSKGKQKAMLIGSSNFTYSGFCENIETNLLLEGPKFQRLIEDKENEFNQWRLPEYSFKPTKEWLKDYRVKYKKRQDKLREAKVKDEATKEEEHAFASSWINKISWKEYYRKILKAIDERDYGYDKIDVLKNKLERLKEYQRDLPLPWHITYFDDLKKRKMMWGMDPYAWLGHVGSSRQIMRILPNGTKTEKQIIVQTINVIGRLRVPIDWQALRNQLIKLTSIGPTIKVWGRFLAITRPDLFCTFSSPTLITNLSETLEVTKSYLESVDGYIEFLKMVHGSPWFHSPRPANKIEAGMWENRVAFLDEVFY